MRNNRPQCKKNQHGFTLMELMVVVAIIAFVSAAVVPSFSITLAKGRQRDAANLIIQAIYAARSLAASSTRCHQVRVTTSTPVDQGGTGGLVEVIEASVAGPCNAVVSSDSFLYAYPVRRLSVQLAGTDVAISATDDASPIYFGSNGGSYKGTTRTYTISHSNASLIDRFVNVDASGRTDFEDRPRK